MGKLRVRKSTVAVGGAESHQLIPWDAPARPPGRRTAVVAVHGMGQQTAFSTLADVAEAIRARAGGGARATARNVSTFDVDDSTLRRSRIELQLPDARDVHVYEAYWAPLTEGAVTLRNVLSFLFYAGLSNLRRTNLTRILFGRRVDFPLEASTPVSLTVALATVASLVAIDAILFVVVAAFVLRPVLGLTWPGDALVVDLSVPAALLSIFALCLGVMIRLASHIKQFAQRWTAVRPLTGIVWAELAVLLAALVTTAVLMMLAVWHHRPLQGNPSVALDLLGGERLAQLARFSWMLLATLALIAMSSQACRSAAVSRVLLWIVVAVNGLLFVLIYLWLQRRGGDGGGTLSVRSWFWVWVMLLVVSHYAQRFLVQYIGDVAAYIQPHRLDRFQDIREKIQKAVFQTVDAVYRAADAGGAPMYDRVVIVAHSLGSVAAYDVLNTLMRIDAARGHHVQVAKRTSALITFGCPLDKVALFFGKLQANEMHEALATSVQPLVYEPRPLWINLYSPNDIISDRLGYFGEKGLINRIDRDASTPLAAHVEYWKNPLLWRMVDRCL